MPGSGREARGGFDPTCCAGSRVVQTAFEVGIGFEASPPNDTTVKPVVVGWLCCLRTLPTPVGRSVAQPVPLFPRAAPRGLLAD